MAHRYAGLDKQLEYLVNTVVDAFKQSIFKLKRGEIKKDFKGYFYTTLVNIFCSCKRIEANIMPLNNWFEENIG